jgi:putative transposase
MQGASWQRCRVHFARNLLARVHKGHGEMVAALFRTVFAQTTPREVATQLEVVATMFDPQFPAAATLLREAGPDLTAFADFPRAHWKTSGGASVSSGQFMVLSGGGEGGGLAVRDCGV